MYVNLLGSPRSLHIGTISDPLVSILIPCFNAERFIGEALPDDGLHGPNEKFSLENFQKGIRTVAHFFESLAPA